MKSTFLRYATCLAMGLLGSTAIQAQDYVDRFALKADSRALELGTQPLSHPNGVIGAVMRRDRVLMARLNTLGSPLAVYDFKRGADMLSSLAERKLDVGLIGDMPATVAAAAGTIWVVGLVEVQQNAIVSREAMAMSALAGKKIGYVPISTAHATLIRALRLNKLNPADVKLLPYDVNELPEALSRQEIDAFAGWEPAVSVALNASSNHRIVFRGQSVDYLVISRAFEKAHPDAALALIAGYVRAINWMRLNRNHLERAAKWAMEDAKAFTGKPLPLTAAQIMAVTRTGILDVPSAPMIVSTGQEPALKAEYELLKSLNKLPPHQSWDHVVSTFQYGGLSEVMSYPRHYELRRFDYSH